MAVHAVGLHPPAWILGKIKELLGKIQSLFAGSVYLSMHYDKAKLDDRPWPIAQDHKFRIPSASCHLSWSHANYVGDAHDFCLAGLFRGRLAIN